MENQLFLKIKFKIGEKELTTKIKIYFVFLIGLIEIGMIIIKNLIEILK